MQAQDMPPPFALYRMITGFYVARAIYVMARLGVADMLGDGPRDAEELAQQSKTHAPSLKRVLKLLVTAGIFTEDPDGRFAVTPIGDHLRAGVPGSMRAAALLFGGITQRAWGDLLHSVETGEPAFRKVFGQDTFAYLADHPEEAANFDTAMADFTAQIAMAVATAYDFSGFRHVGGGNGTLLAGIQGLSSAARHAVRPSEGRRAGAPALQRARPCRSLRGSGGRFLCGTAWRRRCLSSEACDPRLGR